MLSAVANATITIGIILFDGVQIMDFAGPAGYLELVAPVTKTPIEFYTVATQPGPLQPSKYMPLYVTNSYEDASKPFDILIIPGAPATKELVKDPVLMENIRKLADESTDVLTVCTGTRLTAGTGVLDGKSATTNKKNFEEISTSNPNVKWIEHARWVEDGKWWTSSGVTAGMDMTNAYVASRFGADVAAKISTIMEYRPIMESTNDPFAPKKPGCKLRVIRE